MEKNIQGEIERMPEKGKKRQRYREKERQRGKRETEEESEKEMERPDWLSLMCVLRLCWAQSHRDNLSLPQAYLHSLSVGSMRHLMSCNKLAL